MPSFDAVNEIDLQEVDNAINNTMKEIRTRYDFRDSNAEVEFNRKTKLISVQVEDNMKLRAVRDMLVANFIKRKLSPKSMEFKEEEGTSHGGLRQTVVLKEGIDKENAKKIVKLVKDSKIKVQAAVHDDKVRVTGKKIDDLQEVMALIKGSELELPIQFNNMKS
ncbi:MAG: YajQ family cyclic di-GMP-binding protein [Candidatus Cyclonatronum sp.]|uniref:YajQ family cyclic di-GMP-binding protein n=1 Tax=Cyclonatronum sp. TaxID=3024185 RepID=UPI0025BAD88F|nr:YajQ family cyclic di-GMP-binding protein [Cyclonatronum sp.]MCC5934279.1 YajQ family cyclic di-GMP-binding protein [Balneolales bacterium]MCH8485670.1 YajQ family cyclic di-GMP-binding protein [Cyclonatronum sp.]